MDVTKGAGCIETTPNAYIMLKKKEKIGKCGNNFKGPKDTKDSRT